MSDNTKLKLIILVFGPMVPLSYYLAAQYNTAGIDALWGDIPEQLKLFYPIGMLLATIGFFPFTYLIVTRSQRNLSYIIPYLLIFIPSSAWMPLTVLYIDQPSAGLFLLIRVVLLLVPLGAYLIWRLLSSEDFASDGRLILFARIGLLAFIFHTLILDGLVWPWFF